MKTVLFLGSVAAFLAALGCESDHHHHRDHGYRERREHEGRPVYVQPAYPAPPGAIYREYPEYPR